MYWLKNGGPLMYLIVLMSILGLYAVIERSLYFIFHEKNETIKIKTILKQLVENNDVKKVVTELDAQKSSTSRVLREIIVFWYNTKTTNVKSLDEKAREVALAQVPKLERNMWIMSMVAYTTPLIGLLGTVTGMIKAFQSISLHGTGNPTVLATGISQALLTTAGGLFVAIPILIFYNYFNKKIDDKINEMEKGSAELINCFRR